MADAAVAAATVVLLLNSNNPNYISVPNYGEGELPYWCQIYVYIYVYKYIHVYLRRVVDYFLNNMHDYQ